MSNPFVAEIRIVGFNFAPTGWALCNGQLMAISQNTALFSLLGTNYGGDGKSTFGLPNFQGSAPLHAGQGNGLTPRVLGEIGGTTGVALISTEMPLHTHTAMGDASGAGALNSPSGAAWSSLAGRTPPPVYSSAAPTAAMHPLALSVAGGSQPHNNMPPYLVMNFIIALQGIFPARG